MKVTALYLEEMDACEADVKKFKRMFPDGFRPTLKNCLEAADRMDIIWFVEECMTALAQRYYWRRHQKVDLRYANESDFSVEDRDDGYGRALYETFKHYGARSLLKRLAG